MNDMHSKGNIRLQKLAIFFFFNIFTFFNGTMSDHQYHNEGKMSSQKRQEEVFAEEIRNLRKEINTLSSIQSGTLF
jgi:hypothetical protein